MGFDREAAGGELDAIHRLRLEVETDDPGEEPVVQPHRH